RLRRRQVPLHREPGGPRLRGLPGLAGRRPRDGDGGALRRRGAGRPGFRRGSAAGEPAEADGGAQGRPGGGGPPGRPGSPGPAGSHTGSLAGRDEPYRAAFRAAGIVTVDDTEEFFDALAALAAAGDRLPRDPGLAILTISGGPSVVAADAAEAVGLRVPPLPEA